MRTSFIIGMVLLWSCQGRSQVMKEPDQKATLKAIGDTIAIDRRLSSLHWKGTKMRGLGKHEGSIQISEAYLIFDNNQLIGGRFTIDMTSIEVTDIPSHETIPRKRLVDHLKSEDFFNAKQYPTANLEITSVDQMIDSLQIHANLTIKEITRPITFMALRANNQFNTIISFDRFLWNVAYEGNLIDRTLVDKDVILHVELVPE